jgi:hypothetical protein
MSSLFDVLRLRQSDPLAIPGFAGGTLREQVDRQPKPRISFGANGLSGLSSEPLKPTIPPEPQRFLNPEIPPLTRPRTIVPGFQSDQRDVTWDDRPRLVNPQPSLSEPSTSNLPERAVDSTAPLSIRVNPDAAAAGLQRPRYAGVSLSDSSGQPLQGTDRSLALLEAERTAPPASQLEVTDGRAGWSAPKGHHGLFDRLKSAGKGALIDNQSPLRGMLRGAFMPESIDQEEKDARVYRDTQNLGRELQLEDVNAQAEQRRQAPQIAKDTAKARADEQERDNLRAAWAAIVGSGQDFNPDNEEHKQMHDRAQELHMTLPYGKKSANAREPMKVTVKNADGSESVKLSYDNGRSWTESADLKSAPPREKGEGEDFKTLADWNYKKQKEAEQTAAGYESQLKTTPLPAADDPNYWTVKDERDRLQKLLDGAKSDAQKYRDEGDKAAVKVRTQPTPTTSPSGRTWSKSKWAAANPNKDANAAEKAAQFAGYRVVE